MNIAIITSQKHKHDADKLMTACISSQLSVKTVEFNKTWPDSYNFNIDEELLGTGYIICMIDKAELQASWLAYVLGFALGRKIPCAMFDTEEGYPVPVCFAKFAFLKTIDEAVKFCIIEASEWAENQRKHFAKTELLNLGISLTVDSFAKAVTDGDAKAVELFVSAGYSADSKNTSGVPMLCIATRTDNRAIVELLISHGADINMQSDDRGYTALMDASLKNDESILDFLLLNKADPNLVSKDGQTALILAVGRNAASISEKLISHGADPDIQDKLGLSARQYAQLFHNDRITKAINEQNTTG